MKAQYLPKTIAGKVARLAEEAAEVAVACNKTLRIHEEQRDDDVHVSASFESALEGYNPELPEAERETNRDWILREIQDLEHAIRVVKNTLERE